MQLSKLKKFFGVRWELGCCSINRSPPSTIANDQRQKWWKLQKIWLEKCNFGKLATTKNFDFWIHCELSYSFFRFGAGHFRWWLVYENRNESLIDCLAKENLNYLWNFWNLPFFIKLEDLEETQWPDVHMLEVDVRNI